MLLAEEDLKITEFEKSTTNSIIHYIRNSIRATIMTPISNSTRWSVMFSIRRRLEDVTH